jgi:hypothetical protein
MLTDTEPDHHSVVTQLFEEVRNRSGPLWERLNLPEHVIEALARNQPIMSPVVVVDGETYLVLASGKILYAQDKVKELLPTVEDSSDFEI